MPNGMAKGDKLRVSLEIRGPREKARVTGFRKALERLGKRYGAIVKEQFLRAKGKRRRK
jgi:hypothetical protein